jgi:hypothetical protein
MLGSSRVLPLLALALAGCVQTEAPLLDASGSPSHPIRAGYWRVCTAGGNGVPDCSVLQVENSGDSRGVFWDNRQHPPEAFVTRGIKGGFFVLQGVLGDTPSRRRYVYFLGRQEDGGPVTLQSPSCEFSPALLARLQAGGVDLDMLGGTAGCRPRHADAAGLLRFFDVLADNPGWASSLRITLHPLSAAEALAAQDADARKPGTGAPQ